MASIFGRPSPSPHSHTSNGAVWGDTINNDDPAILWYFEQMRQNQPQTVTTPYVPPKSDVAVLERPADYKPTKYTPAHEPMTAYSRDQIAEYSEVAEQIGFMPAGLRVEEFKTYLIESGMTVFSLKTVVAFMDQKSKAEGMGAGWHWMPLRAQDKMLAVETNMNFGRFAGRSFTDNTVVTPASDHFRHDTPLYTQAVPLHALKKVAKIEKEFGVRKVVFAVSDYAPALAFRVDPFLIAIIPNANLARGEGRFVIDVWDEPGFGIEQMLKSDLA